MTQTLVGTKRPNAISFPPLEVSVGGLWGSALIAGAASSANIQRTINILLMQ